MVRTESLILVMMALISPEMLTTQDVAIGTESAAIVSPVTIYFGWSPMVGNTGQFSFNLRGRVIGDASLDQFAWPILTNVTTTSNAVIRDDPTRFIAVTWSNKLTGIEGNTGLSPVAAVCVP